MKKIFKVFKETFDDICGDSYYGKDTRRDHEEEVFCEEHEVKALVDELNSHGVILPMTDEEYKEARKKIDSTTDEDERRYLEYELEDDYYSYWRYVEVGHKPLTIDKLRDRYKFYLE